MNAQPERNQSNVSADNVVQLHDYFKVVEGELDPETLSQAEIHDYILARLTHPSIAGDAHTVARSLLVLFRDDSNDKWDRRAQELALDVGDLDDELYEQVATDTVIKQAMMLIRSKTDHLKGNEEILDAARKLVDLRAGVVLQHKKLAEYDLDRWRSVVRSLGAASLRSQ